MKVVKINLVYRDASYNVTYSNQLFRNKEGLSFGEISEAFKPILSDPIIVQYYGIKSISPIANEFMPTFGDDHAFCEIINVEMVSMGGHSTMKDILDVIEAIDRGGDDEKKKEFLHDAIEELEEYLGTLKDKL
jgi:hypothetical protein